MEVKLKPVNTEELRFTLEVTMKLSDWKELSEQLRNKWPGSVLSRSIDKAVRKCQEGYEGETIKE